MNFQHFNQFVISDEQATSIVGGAKPLTAPTVTLPETAAAVLPSITLPVIDTTVQGAPVITAPVIDTNR
jgi:hypothetical protein